MKPSAPSTFCTSKRKTSRSCAPGSASTSLRWPSIRQSPDSERTLDPRVVARDHVAVAGRADAVVAHDHVVGVAERLAGPRRIERAVAVRVEDAVRGRAAAGDVVLAEVAGDDVGAAVAFDVVVGANRVGCSVAIDRVVRTLAEEQVLVGLAVDRVVAVRAVRLRSGVRRRGNVEQPDHAQDVRLVPARLAPGAVERQPVELGADAAERPAHAVDRGVVADDDVVVAARDGAVTVATVQRVVGVGRVALVDAAVCRTVDADSSFENVRPVPPMTSSWPSLPVIVSSLALPSRWSSWALPWIWSSPPWP